MIGMERQTKRTNIKAKQHVCLWIVNFIILHRRAEYCRFNELSILVYEIFWSFALCSEKHHREFNYFFNSLFSSRSILFSTLRCFWITKHAFKNCSRPVWRDVQNDICQQLFENLGRIWLILFYFRFLNFKNGWYFLKHIRAGNER